MSRLSGFGNDLHEGYGLYRKLTEFNTQRRCHNGTAFGECGEGFARISYAFSVKHINEALERIEALGKSLKK